MCTCSGIIFFIFFPVLKFISTIIYVFSINLESKKHMLNLWTVFLGNRKSNQTYTTLNFPYELYMISEK